MGCLVQGRYHGIRGIRRPQDLGRTKNLATVLLLARDRPFLGPIHELSWHFLWAFVHVLRKISSIHAHRSMFRGDGRPQKVLTLHVLSSGLSSRSPCTEIGLKSHAKSHDVKAVFYSNTNGSLPSRTDQRGSVVGIDQDTGEHTTLSASGNFQQGT